MATRMQQRRGTAEQWTLVDPTLAEGEIGFETDTNQFKIGNGVNAWSVLPYFETLDDIQTYVNNAVAGVIDSAPGTLDTLNELAAAINDDENFFTSITTAYQQYADQAETDAKNYADSQDQALSSTLTQAFENYTDGATTDMATTSYVDTQDGITLTAANQYTDAVTTDMATTTAVDGLIGDATVDGTAGNTITDRIASAVSSIIDSAPDALNTLDEIAAALNDDANLYTTLTNYVDTQVASAEPTFTNNFMLMGA